MLFLLLFKIGLLVLLVTVGIAICISVMDGALNDPLDALIDELSRRHEENRLNKSPPRNSDGRIDSQSWTG